MPMRPVLAYKLMQNLPKLFELARAQGIEPPAIKFKYADGLTRTEAQALLDWGRQVPGMLAALKSMSHPDHKQIRLYSDLVQHFLVHHPQDEATGEPANWQEPLPKSNRIEDWTPEQAQDLITWAEAQPEFAAYHDPAHPEHAAYKRDVELAHRIAHPEAAPEGAPMSTDQVVGADAHTARDKLAWKTRDPDFMRAYGDKLDPAHKQAVAEMTALYAAAYPGPASSGAAPTPAGAPATPQGSQRPAQPAPGPSGQRTAEQLRAHPAYRDGGHPEHKAVVRELSDALLGAGAPGAPATGGQNA
jgi:hypothetical protein